MSIRGREMEVVGGERDSVPAVDGDIESPSGKLVYLYLTVSGGATVEELKRDLDIPTLRLYPILRTLGDRDLIERSADRYVASP